MCCILYFYICSQLPFHLQEQTGLKYNLGSKLQKKYSYKMGALLDNDKTTTPINNRSLVMSGWWCSVAKQYFQTLSNNSDFRIKLCSVRLYLMFFVGWFVSYLRYMCLFAYSGVNHILCCAFVLFVFVLCALCCSGLPYFIVPSVFSNVQYI